MGKENNNNMNAPKSTVVGDPMYGGAGGREAASDGYISVTIQVGSCTGDGVVCWCIPWMMGAWETLLYVCSGLS